MAEDLPFKAEYAKSNRSSCKLCRENIAKDSLRVAKMVQSPHFDGKIPNWFHFSCFFRKQKVKNWTDIWGFDSLRWEDQEKVKAKIERGGGGGNGAPSADALENGVSDDLLVEYAKSNRSKCKNCKEQIDKGEIRLAKVQEPDADSNAPAGMAIPWWHHVDCFVQCRESLSVDSSVTGESFTGFTALKKEDKDLLKRKLGKVAKAKGKGSKRKAVAVDETDSKRKKTAEEDEMQKQLKEQSKRLWKLLDRCSDGMRFGRLLPCEECSGGQLVYRTEGYCCTGNLTAWTKCMFVTKDPKRASWKISDDLKEASDFLLKQNKGKLSTAIEDLGGSVVEKVNNSVDCCISSQAEVDKKSKKMQDAERFDVPVAASAVDGAVVSNGSGSKVMKSGLEGVDIVRGANSYYKLQLLKDDKKKSVGTTIGGTKLERCDSKADAIQSFLNFWEDRKNFVKRPNKFYPLEIDYGQDNEELKSSIAAGSKSLLAPAIQELIKMIFDVESMKKTLIEFEIDLQKMPLGKLTKRQIETAYAVLGEAQKLISDGRTSSSLLDASNRFYTLIPHDFGMKKPPLLDNLELIKTKVGMLDNLLDIEVAYSLLKSGEDDLAKDPLDVNYEKLKTDLEVFKVNRHGEGDRFQPFKELHNRRLLWHGSRTTNYAGILSQGLRIAPPEAPVSANYCRTTPSDNIGLLMLCEVALGNMHELLDADNIVKLPKGKHSVKGCGRTGPDPASDVTLKDGTVVPCGKGTKTTVSNSNQHQVLAESRVQVQIWILNLGDPPSTKEKEYKKKNGKNRMGNPTIVTDNNILCGFGVLFCFLSNSWRLNKEELVLVLLSSFLLLLCLCQCFFFSRNQSSSIEILFEKELHASAFQI
ncbi:Poly [ADP-ribose] polymerase [Acropora cervicornis]|uniref:Poly [ADP-ribose] polymerase n=1 Tax=Acropora cervicornis TaxID=6130 RepID=A0AAD9QTY8_ACRCE|nr:Poly [ADP-ribose] polymerase [Acropora cervicornis]